MRIATKSSKLNISKLENTKKIADIFAKNIFKGNVILFYGEIGVGKTTFIKSLVNSLEKIDKKNISEITSPTFSLMNHYKLDKFDIHHYDLYRLKSEKDKRGCSFSSGTSIFRALSKKNGTPFCGIDTNGYHM